MKKWSKSGLNVSLKSWQNSKGWSKLLVIWRISAFNGKRQRNQEHFKWKIVVISSNWMCNFFNFTQYEKGNWNVSQGMRQDWKMHPFFTNFLISLIRRIINKFILIMLIMSPAAHNTLSRKYLIPIITFCRFSTEFWICSCNNEE